MAYGAQLDCYEQSSDTLKQMTGLQLSAVQIWRVADCYGKAVEVYNTEAPTRSLTPLLADQMLYVQADGSMILTRNGNGWKEVKLGRIFKSSDCLHPDGKAGWVSNSQYLALLGNSTAFIESMNRLLADYGQPHRKMIFITDGALWLRDWIEQHYPQATSILDYYHAAEHLHAFTTVAFRHHRDPEAGPAWAAKQKALLLDSRLEDVLKNIGQAAATAATDAAQESAASLISYYKSNRDRLDYARYRELGCGLIGSGAIESGHRTVIQKRMKRSGQRWSESGAQHMLNLRVVNQNKQWARVVDIAGSPKNSRAA